VAARYPQIVNIVIFYGELRRPLPGQVFYEHRSAFFVEKAAKPDAVIESAKTPVRRRECDSNVVRQDHLACTGGHYLYDYTLDERCHLVSKWRESTRNGHSKREVRPADVPLTAVLPLELQVKVD
jgi:hypothetical protein